MDIDNLLDKLEMMKIIIQTDDEVSRFDISKFLIVEYTKGDGVYVKYLRRKDHNGKQIFKFIFQHPKIKRIGTDVITISKHPDKVKSILTKKWEKYKSVNMIDVPKMKELLSGLIQMEI